MQIFILGAVLIALAGLLGFIVIRTSAMIRQRQPLIAIGPVQWQAPARPAPAPKAQAEPVPATGFGRAAPDSAPAPDRAPEPENAPPRERARKLVSLSELELAETAPPAIEPGYYAQLETRLETAFEALCGGTIDLPDYIAQIDEEYAGARRAQASLGPLAPDALHTEAAEAIAALEWCHDWATQQWAQQST